LVESTAKKKIAIADDEESVCSILSILLTRMGYSAEFVAHDGTEILEAVLTRAIEPDLIIMDYRMPVMDGIEAARAIMKERPTLRIIIESADDAVKESVQNEGMLFLQKPFNRSQLSRIVDTALDLLN
jgi:DNA-binding NtrC family response regulator